MRFSNFLSNTLKFLNIANRAIPLIKDVSPGVSKVKKFFKGYQNKTVNKTYEQGKELKKESTSLTFFK